MGVHYKRFSVEKKCGLMHVQIYRLSRRGGGAPGKFKPFSKWQRFPSDVVKNVVKLLNESVFLNQSSMFVSGPSQYLNYIFTGIFIIEAIIRLIAMRLDYFKLGWNVFDFIIVVFSIVGELIVTSGA